MLYIPLRSDKTLRNSSLFRFADVFLYIPLRSDKTEAEGFIYHSEVVILYIPLRSDKTENANQIERRILEAFTSHYVQIKRCGDSTELQAHESFTSHYVQIKHFTVT